MLDIVMLAIGFAFFAVSSPTSTPAISCEEAHMIFDYTLAGLVTAGLLIYLVYALLKPELF